MDQFMDGLRAEGSIESEGAFTMAVQEASWKLAAFRLADPQSYPLHLIASAVESQASHVTILRSSNSVLIHFDGRSFNQSELDMLRLPVLGSEVPRRIRELAIAVSAASALGRTRFCSVSRQGEGCQLEVDGTEVTLSSGEGIRGQLLEVRAPLSDLAVDLLKTRCRFAPVDLSVDKESLRGPIDFGIRASDYYGYYLRQGTVDLVVRPHTLTTRRFFVSSEPASPSSPTLTLALTGKRRARRGGFTLIDAGIGHRMPDDFLGLPFLCGAVSAEGLQKDISQRGYVENRRYHELLEYVHSSVADFLNRFCAHPVSGIPASTLHDLQHHLFRMLSEGRLGDSVKAFVSNRPKKSVSITDTSTLKGAGEAAAEGDDTDYLRIQRTLREELGRVRQSGEGRYKASVLLECEAHLHQAAGRVDPEQQELLAVWQALIGPPKSDDGPDTIVVKTANREPYEWERWASSILDRPRPEVPPLRRFRAQLILLAQSTPKQVESWLADCPLPAEWTALIRYALLQAGQGVDDLSHRPLACWEVPLRGLEYAHRGQYQACLEEFFDLHHSAKQQNGYARWLELGSALTHGRVGVASWAKVRASLSLAALNDPNWNLWSGYRDWRGRLRAATVCQRLTRRNLVRGAFNPHFAPLLLYRLTLCEGSAEAFEILSPVLLQQSLGPLNRPLFNLDQTPEQGLLWQRVPGLA